MNYNSRMDDHRDEYRVHRVVYHLVGCPKRRKPVPVGKVAERLKEVIQSKCDRKNKIQELAEGAGHKVLFLPKYSPDLNEIEHDFSATWDFPG